MSIPPANPSDNPAPNTEAEGGAEAQAAAELALDRLVLLRRLCRFRELQRHGPPCGVLEATLSVREVRELFTDGVVATRYPPIMTYAQAADLVQVSVNTLKGWFCQGKYAKCVKRGNPGRVLRDPFVRQFLRDEFGINDE